MKYIMRELHDIKRAYDLLQKEIHELKLSYNYDNGFKKKEDLSKFIEENRDILEQSNNLKDQITQLEWELLSPAERAKKEQQRKLSKLKRQGKL